MTTPAVEQIVNNKVVTLASRASMILSAPLLTAIISVAGWYFSSQNTAIIQISDRVGTIEVKIAERVTSVEREQVEQRQAIALLQAAGAREQIQRDRDQTETLARLDRMQDSLTQLSNSVAALTAVLQQQQRATIR